MSTDVVAVPRHTSLAQAEQLLLHFGVEELFVVDHRRQLCGIVPDYELLKCRLSPEAEWRTVENIMSRRLLVIDADAPLAIAGRYLREHVHRRLAVVEERRLIGQITRRALLARLVADDQSPAESGTCPDVITSPLRMHIGESSRGLRTSPPEPGLGRVPTSAVVF